MSKVGIILAFTAGAAIGTVGGIMIAKKRYSAIMEQEINDSVLYFREKYENLRKEIKGSEVETESENTEDEEETDVKGYKRDKSTIDDISAPTLDKQVKYNTIKDQEDYNKIIADMNYAVENSEKKKDHPYPIDMSQFTDDDEFEKVDLTYYPDDDIFVDIDGDVVENGIDIIGRDNLTEFGVYEEDTLYVRNENTGTDYEVIMGHGQFLGE